jgi:hypothetical protein
VVHDGAVALEGARVHAVCQRHRGDVHLHQTPGAYTSPLFVLM